MQNTNIKRGIVNQDQVAKALMNKLMPPTIQSNSALSEM